MNNIFDTVFRTIAEYLPRLIIPILNEAFQMMYTIDEPLRVLKNEHVTHGGKLITDLFFELGRKYYHVELQSVPDGKMVIRIMEYASAIAIEHAEEKTDGSYHMRFPDSCVIYLRSTKNTPDRLRMHVEFPNGETVTFEAPSIKVQEYTKEHIFQKKLLMLLPYYLMRYEKELKEIGKIEPGRQEEADSRMEVFLEEYRDILEKLFERCEETQDYYLYATLAEQVQSIAEYLAPVNQKERVIAMGGTVIKPQAQILVEQGRLSEKRENALSLSDMGMAPEKIAQAVRVSVDTVKQWLEGGAAAVR